MSAEPIFVFLIVFILSLWLFSPRKTRAKKKTPNAKQKEIEALKRRIIAIEKHYK